VSPVIGSCRAAGQGEQAVCGRAAGQGRDTGRAAVGLLGKMPGPGEGAVSAGRCRVSQDQWPARGPHRRFLELLDEVHRANGTKSLRTIAGAMNLSGPNRVSILLRGTSLPCAVPELAQWL